MSRGALGLLCSFNKKKKKKNARCRLAGRGGARLGPSARQTRPGRSPELEAGRDGLERPASRSATEFVNLQGTAVVVGHVVPALNRILKPVLTTLETSYFSPFWPERLPNQSRFIQSTVINSSEQIGALVNKLKHGSYINVCCEAGTVQGAAGKGPY